VIPTVPIDFPTVFAIGALVAISAHRQIYAEQVGVFSRYVKAGALFGFVFGIAVGWMCLYYPDWMWVYGLPIREWPFWFWYPAFVVGLTLAAASGTIIAQAFISQGKLGMAVFTGLLGLFVLGVFWTLTFEQYTHLSTYAEWHATPRVATFFQEDADFQMALNIIGPVELVFGLGIVGKFFMEGRRLPRL